MRKYAFITLLCLAMIRLTAQDRMQHAITAAGGTRTAPDRSFFIGWTIGETLVSAWRADDGSITLSGGVNQMIIVTAVEESPGWEADVTVYPNPASSIVIVKFFMPSDGKFLLYLHDAGGRLIRTDEVEKSAGIKQINVDDLPAGTYFLRLADGPRSKTYKVVKL